MGQSETENRQWQRVKIDVRVVWIVGDGSTVRGAIGRAYDISEGGISVMIPARIALNQPSEIEFTLPGSRKPIRTQVVARSSDGFRYGFQFVTLSSTQRLEISRVCERLSVLEYAAC